MKTSLLNAFELPDKFKRHVVDIGRFAFLTICVHRKLLFNMCFREITLEYLEEKLVLKILKIVKAVHFDDFRLATFD